MDMSSLIAAQHLDCNQFTYDQQEIDRAALRVERRRDLWRSRLATMRILVRSLRFMPAFQAVFATVKPVR